MIFDYIKNRDWPKKNIAITAGVLFVMLALYSRFVTPHCQYLLAAEKYERAAEKVERTRKTVSAVLTANQKRFDKVSQNLAAKKQEFFEIGAAQSFLDGIQSKAEKNQCAVESLNFVPARQITVEGNNPVDIWQYQVNLSFVGRYQNIVKMLDSLQNRKQKVWIDTMNLHLKNQTTDLLVCELSLSIYVLKVKEI
jgi:hypothetical protein